MPKSKKTPPRFPRLKPGRLLKPAVEKTDAILKRAGTTVMTPNKHGIYPATSGLEDGSISGMHHGWVRDIAKVIEARHICGETEASVAGVQGMLKYWKTQVPRIETILADPKLKEDIQDRPHIRFDAGRLEAVAQKWSHAQNDAWAYLKAISLRVAIDTGVRLSREAEEIIALHFQYLDAIDYSSDPDSGAWEEERKLNSSSIAAVIRALLDLGEYVRKFGGGSGPLYRVESMAAAMIARGRRVLKIQLPFEAPPIRYADAALLFSLYPTEVIPSMDDQNLILGQVEARLLGPIGIRRYNGDSYYCADYDRYFSPNQLSNDHDLRTAVRDQYLVPGQEAQWCIFDSVLSVIYGRRYAQSGSDLHRDQQLRFMQRALEQLTPEVQCPEMYYLKRGEWQTNPHTPLVWARANLKVAMRQLAITAEKEYRRGK